MTDDIFDFFAKVFSTEPVATESTGEKLMTQPAKAAAMNMPLSGTPHKKRKRRTRAELETLDSHLYDLVRYSRPCTVRQIYYRAVVAYLCDKTDSGYNLIQRRLLAMRRNGELPYGWIEDNTRSFYGRKRYRNLEEFGIEASRGLYALDYWADNPVNVEVWCESDSIAGTLRHTVTQEWGLRLHVARGFSSETYVYNAGEEIKEDRRETFIYILSDFDPSGITLAEDIAGKLTAFADPVPVTVKRIALSGEQVSHWRLPTHPLKKSDKRAKTFRRIYGDEACELEAIAPGNLRDLVAGAIAQHIEPRRIKTAKQDEWLQRQGLEQLPAFFREWHSGSGNYG